MNRGVRWLLTRNIAVFLIVKIAGEAVLPWLVFPAGVHEAATHFWTAITYMFTHTGLTHFLFNMLWLAVAGVIIDAKNGFGWPVATYLTGGLAGAVAFLTVAAPGSSLVGASAAILALAPQAVLALCDRMPFSINKRLAISLMASVAAGSLVWAILHPTHVSALVHTAGFMAGAFAVVAKAAHDEKKAKLLEDKEKEGEIEGRIATSGYESLTPEEKARLYQLSDTQDENQ